MGNININGQSAVHAKSEGKLISSDVCLTPPFCVPISYTNVAESKTTDQGASSCNIQGSPACNQKSSFKVSQGDAPGACAGASSGSIGQKAEFITSSQDVMIEGKPAVRNGDKMISNCKNSCIAPLNQPPAGDAPAGTAKAPPAAEGEYSQTINFAGLIGRDVDNGQLFVRFPYVAYDEKGELIPGGSGTLSKDGLTAPIFTTQAEKIKVVLGDGEWRKFGDVVHDGGGESEGEQSSESANQLNMRFFGVDGEGIKGLECKVCIGDKTELHTTDEEGLLPAIKVESTSKLELSVKKFDGSYKVIDKVTVTSSHVTLEYVSPKIVVEVKTEKHKGDPGSAESQAPQPTPQDRGDKPIAPKKPKEIPKNISGKKPVKKDDALKPGRNKDGNPQITFAQKVTDWWNKWSMPSLNLWNVNAATKSLAANGGSQSGPKGDADAIKRVEQIIEFLEDQADYDYKKGEGTATVLTAMAKGTFKHKHDEKPKTEANGKCYQYVKIALVSNQWVANAEALEGESASSAGPRLIAAGFIDVTDTMPDARWAAPGDVIVYKWTAEHLEYMRSKTKKNDPKYPNHGHIDIRSYDNYLTDFIPPRNQPNWSHYDAPRVYRLYYDPVPILRMKAFLSCIREYEGQEEKNEAKRYQLLNCALPDSKDKYFSSFDTHPWEQIPKDKRGKATAAGAYQILYTRWDELLTGRDGTGAINLKRKMFSLKNSEKKFTPELQDRMAVAILEERQALGYVRKGEIDKAVEKLNGTWSSFPGGKENAKRITADKRPMNIGYFKELYDRYLTEEKKKAGVK